MRIAIVALALALSAPAMACDDPAHLNAARDAARAQEKQADTLRQMERNQREQNKMLDRQIRNSR